MHEDGGNNAEAAVVEANAIKISENELLLPGVLIPRILPQQTRIGGVHEGADRGVQEWVGG